MAELTMPVTVVMARRAAENRAADLSVWAGSLCTAASTFPGHLGQRVEELSKDGSTEIVIGLSFATSVDLVRWEQSDERASALVAGAELTQGSPTSLSLGAMDAQVGDRARNRTIRVHILNRDRLATEKDPAGNALARLIGRHLRH